MTDATELDLPAVKARLEAATEGPWEETWRPIADCDGYEVSDFGNVRSHWAKGNHKQKRSAYPRVLKPRDNSNGYASVSLPKPGGGFGNRAVHRLVAEAFIGPAPDGTEVAHLNGDRSDARSCNLAYVTHVENEAHKREHGTHGAGERNSQARFQGWQVAEVKFLAARSVPQFKIAELFDMDRRTVSDILNGRAWKSVDARTDIPLLVTALAEARAEVAKVRNVQMAGWERATAAESARDEALAERDRANARAEDYEGRYETSHASRMHAEDCYRRAESARDAAEDAIERVRALHDKTHWCFGGKDVSDLRDDCVFDPSTDDWPCPTLGALAPVAIDETEGGDRG